MFSHRLFFCFFSLTIVLVSTYESIYAQQKWTLEKCIAYAKENNLQVRQAGYDVEIASTNLNTARNSYLPTIEASASYINYLERSVNLYTYTFMNNNHNSDNFYVNGNFYVFKGFQRKYAIKQSDFTLRAVLMDIEKARNDISLNITSVYFELLYYDELIKTDSTQISETNRQIARAKELVKGGVKTETYLYDLITQQAQDNLNMLLDKTNYQSSLIALIQLLEIKSPVGFEIEKPNNLEMFMSLNPDTFVNYYKVAIVALPQIKGAQYRLQSFESNVEYTKGNNYPVLSFETVFNTGYVSNSKLFDTTTGKAKNYPFKNQIKNNMNMYYGFNLSIPIFSRFQVRNAVRVARNSQSKAELNVELSKKQVYKDIQTAYYDALSANEKIKSMETLLNATKLSFTYAEEKLNAGIISIYDYSALKTKLVKATSDYLQAKYEYIFKMKILDFYKGNSISLQN